MATIISSKTSGVGGLSVTGDASGVLQLASADGTTAVTIDASQNVTFAGSVNTPNTFGFKNRIINGGMVIDQRNAGASVTPNGVYTLDRWVAYQSVASKYSLQQNAGAVTPPVGFSNYLGITSLSAYSVVSGDAFTLRQSIEGFNIADLGWGTANASTVTLSFWARSSLTGTFGGTLNNLGYVESYPFTYTISAANTWEKKSITIAGDTTGTWATGNTNGVIVGWSLGAGTTFSGTAGSWATATYTSATGAVSVVGTSGATFYITGVQLEKGSTATSFDYRDYGRELALCQRYYYRVTPGALNVEVGIGGSYLTTAARILVALPVTMRIAPTSLEQTGTASNYNVIELGLTVTVCSAVPAFSTANVNSASITLITASGLTGNRPASMYTASTTAFFGLSAEL